MRLALLVMWLASGLVISNLCAQETPSAAEKAPVPEKAALERSEQEVKAVYGAQQAAAKTRLAKLELAQVLIQDAIGVKDDPSAVFVMLRAASTIAASQGETALAMRACTELEARYAVTDPRLEPLRELVAKKAAGVVDVAKAQIAPSMARDDYATALEYAKLAEASARGNTELLKSIQHQRKQLEAARAEYAALAEHQRKLQVDALDAPANLAVGKFMCLRKGDWASGLTYLAAAQDADLSKLAETELRGPADAKAQAALGDRWWDYAKNAAESEQLAYKQRASHWYAQAVPGLSGLVQLRAQARLAEVPAPTFTATTTAAHYLESLKPGQLAIVNWNGSRWQPDVDKHLKIDRTTQGWRMRMSYTDGWGARIAMLTNVEPRERKLKVKVKVVEGYVKISVRPLDGSDASFGEVHLKKGESQLLEFSVRDNHVFNKIDGTAVDGGSKIESAGPIAYAILMQRAGELEFETFVIE